MFVHHVVVGTVGDYEVLVSPVEYGCELVLVDFVNVKVWSKEFFSCESWINRLPNRLGSIGPLHNPAVLPGINITIFCLYLKCTSMTLHGT